MAQQITHREATAAARDFVASIKLTGEWNTDTIARVLPRGWTIPLDADYAGPVTIASVAAFIRAEAVAE